MPKVPPEVLTRTSLQKAQRYLMLREYGRAFAHYLVVFTLSPTTLNDTKLREDFTFAVGQWGQELEKQKRISELFHTYQSALELFPTCHVILINLGAHLFRLGCLEEAASYFKQAVDHAPHSILAKEYLDNINNALVERWHFVMLNSISRNQAFKLSIERAVSKGYDTVLDIGSGTGILSMFAASAGARHVSACEVSKTMYDVAVKVLESNALTEDVKLIHIKSTDLLIPQHVPERVSLVVTETFDAAVFGENILDTLIHAWNHLLMTPLSTSECKSAQVIPSCATLWACLIECRKIREYSRIMTPAIDFTGCQIPTFLLDPSAEEPYTTERLSEIRHGYRKLSATIKILEVDFNSVEQLQMLSNGWTTTLKVSFITSGSFDAVAVWFDLGIDDIIKISTSPEGESCWDQAIFPVASLLQNNCDVSTDSNVHLTFAIQETLQLVDATLHSHQKCTVMEPSFCISLPPNDVLLLNDHVYHSALKIALMSYQFNEQRNYFVISSVAAFVVATSLGDVYDVQYIDHLMNRQPSLEIVKQVSLNQCGNAQQQCGQHSRPTLSYLLSEIVESTGVMNPDVLSEVALLRESNLQHPLCVIPRVIRCLAVLIESDCLAERNSLINDEKTLGFKISEHINAYKVLHHLNLDLSTLPHKKLSNPELMLEVDFNAINEGDGDMNVVPTFLSSYKKTDVVIKAEGRIVAIAYWFELLLADHVNLSTLNSDSHWNQAAFILDNEVAVSVKQQVSLVTELVNGHLRISLDQNIKL